MVFWGVMTLQLGFGREFGPGERCWTDSLGSHKESLAKDTGTWGGF